MSQCKFEDGLEKNIVAIPSTSGPPNSTRSNNLTFGTPYNNPHAASTSPISRLFIAGVTLGGAVFLILGTLGYFFLNSHFRKRQQKHQAVHPPDLPPRDRGDVESSLVVRLPEMDLNCTLGTPELPGSGRFELRADVSSTLRASQTPQDQQTGLEPPAQPEISRNSVEEDAAGPAMTLEPPSRPVLPESRDRKSFSMHLMAPTSWPRPSKPHTPNNSVSDDFPRSLLSIRCQPAPDLDRPLPETPRPESPRSHVVSIRLPSGHTTVEISGYWDAGLF